MGHFELEADWKANIAALKYLKPEVEEKVIDGIKGQFDHIVTTYKNWDKKCEFMMVGFLIGLLAVSFFATVLFTSQLSAFVFAVACGAALTGLTFKGLKNISNHKNNEITKTVTAVKNDLDNLKATIQ